MKNHNFDLEALEYHRAYPPGKLAIRATKPLTNRRDLSLAYSPGVAAACNAIADNPRDSSLYTSRGNLVAVISNGTAVLGLGNIGALASKPVMEGKAVLFKRFGGLDVFDLEINETDVGSFCDVVSKLEPTFSGINLEDIKAPECFEIERTLKEKMNIPVFHDDQHGTAITVGAALINALHLSGKKAADIRVVCNGAGAAGLACLDMFVALGVQKANITLCDSRGVVYKGRGEGMNQYKQRYERVTSDRTLADAIKGADVFLGLSKPGSVTPEMVKSMSDAPFIFAMANPDPEIYPNVAKEARPDAICATGRSDFPNQINNVLCFPFMFRGALDVGATEINEQMKIACSQAIADLARLEAEESVRRAYAGENLVFGPELIIPKPFDPRLITHIPTAVAKAAMESGVATRPLDDLNGYRHRLGAFIYRSNNVMEMIINRACNDPRRVAFADGENKKVLKAVQDVVDEGIAKPILIGRKGVIQAHVAEGGLRLDLERDVELVDMESDSRYHRYHSLYHRIQGREGVTPELARAEVRINTTVAASLMLRQKECDAVICGISGDVRENLHQIHRIIGGDQNFSHICGTHCVLLNDHPVFLSDTMFHSDPNSDELVNITVTAAEVVKNFGLTPKIALLSHSNFGSSDLHAAKKMARACERIKADHPELCVDGEMQADAAMDPFIRGNYIAESSLDGEANLLIFPNIDAASIAYRLLKKAANDFTIGPILGGVKQPVHMMNAASTSRSIYNMTAYAVNEAQNCSRGVEPK